MSSITLHWLTFKSTLNGVPQVAGSWAISAEVGSLSLEFTRLSQLSGDAKYFDAIQRITNVFQDHQDTTKLPGMWPVIINAQDTRFDGDGFSLGAMADSVYEYLPKEHMLLGGLLSEYSTMYEKVVQTAKKNLFFRPLNPRNLDILMSGVAKVGDENSSPTLEPQGQHLVCFVGGMLAIGAKLFDQPEDLVIAKKLTDGCIWAYSSFDSGIMPEVFQAIPCTTTECTWSEATWHTAALSNAPDDFNSSAEDWINEQRLAPGFTKIQDRRYILRPEAIESIFILYRITGDESLRERAWEMFQAVEKHTKTDIAHAALDDMTVKEPPKADRMESFWTAETLKYYFLLFSEPTVISLDDYVLNTEAHPLKRPK